MSDDEHHRDRRVRRLLVGSSGLLVLEILVGGVVRYTMGAGAETAPLGITGTFLIGVATSIPFVFAIAYAGVRLPDYDVDPGRYRRIGYWCGCAGATFVLVNVPLMLLFPMPVEGYVSWVRWALAIGGGVGVWIGIIEARAIERTLAIERERIRADQLEAQRDLFDYLHSLLRHEVLNTANTIDGYASLLLDRDDLADEARDHVGVVSRQSADLETIVEDMQSLLTVLRGRPELEPLDLERVVTEVTESFAATNTGFDAEVDVPPGTAVYGDPLLRRLFGNLVRNAIQHADGDVTVRIRATSTDGTVVVSVADDGPGIPEELHGTLFERPKKTQVNHGLGLYLVGKIAEYHRGDVGLLDTDADGTAFRVELPRASEDPSARESATTASPSAFGL